MGARLGGGGESWLHRRQLSSVSHSTDSITPHPPTSPLPQHLTEAMSHQIQRDIAVIGPRQVGASS